MLSEPKEEIALPIKGKKHKLDSQVLIDYFGRIRLGLNQKMIQSIIDDLSTVAPLWDKLIGISFLPDEMKKKYKQVIKSRLEELSV